MARELVKINELKKLLEKDNQYGILFCFGTSFISKLIQAKTRLNPYEKVPSHVAIIFGGYIYESTTEIVKINKKIIPPGVRRWLLSDYLKHEKKKETSYDFFPAVIRLGIAEEFVHRPYGKDIILDYLLEDGSDGSKNGLICSQFANKVVGYIDKEVVSPAELYRFTISNQEGY